MKKKILIFMDWYKPGYKAGGPIQSISNLINLLNNEFDFYIVTRNTDYLDSHPYPGIETNTWLKSDKVSTLYLDQESISYFKVNEIISKLKPEVVYLNSLYSIYFSIVPLFLSKKSNITTILAVRGMLSKGSFSVKKYKKKIFLIMFRLMKFHKYVKFHATTEDEKCDIINKVGSSTDIKVVQNIPRIRSSFSYKSRGEKLRLVYVGRIAPEKNLRFAIKAINEVHSEVVFDIYGPVYDQSYWGKCEDEIKKAPNNVKVSYQGVLPHDELDETLSLYHILFLPSTGENFGHIISEAMMNFCIPLISDKTPWRSLHVKNAGFDLDIETTELFTKKIDLLASKDELQLEKMANNANQFVHNQIDKATLFSLYKNLFN